jgi:hypothetical protein
MLQSLVHDIVSIQDKMNVDYKHLIPSMESVAVLFGLSRVVPTNYLNKMLDELNSLMNYFLQFALIRKGQLVGSCISGEEF